MGIGVIVLLVLGVIAIVLGFIIPVGNDVPKDSKEAVESAVRKAVDRSIQDSSDKIRQRVDDTIEESLIRTERGLDRLTNEKMGAISEYADTVMNDIHKNHDEVMFMYDMLNDKHKNLTSAVSEAARTEAQARQTVQDAALTAQQAREEASRVSMMAHGINPGSANMAPPTSNSAAGYYDAATPPVSFHNNAARDFFGSLGLDNTFSDPNASGIEQAKAAMEKVDRNRPQSQSSVFGDVKAGRTSIETPLNMFDGIETESSGFAPMGVPEHISQAELDKQFARVFGATDQEEPQPDNTGIEDEMNSVRDIASSVSDKVISITEGSRRGTEEPMIDEQSRQNNTILDMHEQGKSNIAIARELGLGVGEVGLVIELSQKNRRRKQQI